MNEAEFVGFFTGTVMFWIGFAVGRWSKGRRS